MKLLMGFFAAIGWLFLICLFIFAFLLVVLGQPGLMYAIILGLFVLLLLKWLAGK
jgi:hypothetical protein